MNWYENYIGRAHVKGVYDCAELVMEVERNEFDRNVLVPVERQDYSNFKLSSLIDEHKFEMAEHIDNPIEGDVLLMKSNNRLNHIGVYLEIGGVPYTLHNLQKAGVCLHRIDDLAKWGLIVEGFYRFRSDSINTVTNNKNNGGHDTDRTFSESATTC